MSAKPNFDESYREWSERPTSLRAEDVVERLGSRKQRLGVRSVIPATAVLAVLAAFVGGVTWWLRASPPGRAGTTQGSARQPAVNPDDFVVVWVDEKTPVQVFMTDASARGTK